MNIMLRLTKSTKEDFFNITPEKHFGIAGLRIYFANEDINFDSIDYYTLFNDEHDVIGLIGFYPVNSQTLEVTYIQSNKTMQYFKEGIRLIKQFMKHNIHPNFIRYEINCNLNEEKAVKLVQNILQFNIVGIRTKLVDNNDYVLFEKLREDL